MHAIKYSNPVRTGSLTNFLVNYLKNFLVCTGIKGIGYTANSNKVCPLTLYTLSGQSIMGL